MSRPPIPLQMKRRIRKRCGYGCIFCGKPIYEYHHINGYKLSTGHIENEITLLCDSCHRKERNGLIPKELVVEANGTPLNWRNGTTEPERVWYSKQAIAVVIGNNVVHVPEPSSALLFIPVLLDGRAILKLESQNGVWLLSLAICDPWNRNMIEIQQNELVVTLNQADIQFSGGKLTLKVGKDLFFEAIFAPPNFIIYNAILLWNGIAVAITPSGMTILNRNGAVFSDLESAYCPIGFSIGRDPKNRGSAWRCVVQDRFLHRNDKVEIIPESDIDLIQSEID